MPVGENAFDFEEKKSLTIREMYIGQSASRTRTFTEGDVFVFIGLTRDINPIHYDEAFARTTKFGKRLVPAPFTSTLITGVLGQQLPGGGSIYVSQKSKFTAPVFFGDTVTCTVTVTDINVERNRVTLSTVLTNQDGVVVLEGEAVSMPIKEPA